MIPPRVPHIAQQLFQRHFLLLLVGCYALAMFWPGVGMAIRESSIEPFSGSLVHVSIPTLMLALLLFNAGLGTETSQFMRIVRYPTPVLLGSAFHWLTPVIVVLVLGCLPNIRQSDVFGPIVAGLVIVAAMPAANSSVAWSQNTNGNLTVSLGLVLCTTLFSPLVAVGLVELAPWFYDERIAVPLGDLTGSESAAFLTFWVILPAFLGIGARHLFGEQRIRSAQAWIKLLNAVTLLLLNYSNASLSLPNLITGCNVSLTGFLLAATFGTCGLAFLGAWILGPIMRADHEERRSLLFGVGMKNTGAAMVMVSHSLAQHPEVMLPIIVYTLCQHILAASFTTRWATRTRLIPAEQT